MSDYQIICTALPHGPYESGRMRLTLLLHLQYKRVGEVRLSTLELFHKWTEKIEELLRRPGAHHDATLQFHRLGGEGSAEQPALFSRSVTLDPSRLQRKVWNALLADDPIVRVSDSPEPEEGEKLEVNSYSQAQVAKNLLAASMTAALGDPKADRSTVRPFDLDGGDYPNFPNVKELEEAYDDVNPFAPGAHSLREENQLLEAAFNAAGDKRGLVERDVARLKRFSQNAPLKPLAVQDIVSIHGGGTIIYSESIKHLEPPLGALEKTVSAQRWQNVKALWFHRPIHNEDGHHTINQLEGPPPELDFHERLSIYGNNPALLRPLGLAFDLEFVLTESERGRLEPQASPESQATYLVRADLTTLLGGLTTRVDTQSTFTAFKIQKVGNHSYCVLANRNGSKAAFEGATPHRDGMFDFKDRRRYALISSEPVAPLMRAVFASVKTEEADDLPGQPPHHLRGAGLVLTMEDRDKQALQDLEASKQAATDLVFYSEDLVLGYRVDVQRFRFRDGRPSPVGDRWRSLCERTSTYQVVNKKGDEILSWTPDQSDETVNEGYIQASAYTRLADSGKNEYQANGAVFRWDNWSLSVPLPYGKTVKDCDEIEHAPGEGTPQFSGLKPVHAVKKRSLPKLEYGDGYRVRMRAVDLAGNSYALDEAPEVEPFVLGASDSAESYMHERVEPIGVPEVLLAKAFHAGEQPGEHLTHLVIRGAGFEGAKNTSGRFVVPPRVPQQFAEMHGVAEPFDPARGAFFDGELNPNGPYLEMRPDGSFIRACDVWGECDEVPDCDPVRKKGGKENSKPDAENPVYKFTTRRGDVPQNPFFPDPAARFARILLRGNKPGGVTSRLLDFDFYRRGKWPNVIPFGIQLHGTNRVDTTMQWLRSSDPNSRRRGDGAGDILAVYLPPSQTAHLVIHCLPSLKSILNEDPEPFSLRTSASFALSNEITRELAKRRGGKAPAGRPNLFQHWAVSSSLVLKLVHAVERPLDEPEFTALCVRYAPQKPCPEGVPERPCCDDEAKQEYELNSTSVRLAGTMKCHQRSTGRLEIIAHWEEPFDDPNKPDFDLAPVAHRASVFFRNLSTDESESPQPNLTLPHDLRHDFGDTRHREIAYGIEASSRFKEYYTPTDDEKRFTVATPDEGEKQFTILSRARPSLCVVNCVTPAFRWTSSPGGGKRDVIRERQCYSRVWIERPWFSSGAGEQLGVVLLPSGPEAAAYKPESIGRFVSHWGSDPLWSSPQFNRPLSPGDFLGHVRNRVGLKLEEANFFVDVVAYDVHYSTERHMWYADVQFKPNGSYFPFVKLAVARYQHHSIPGVEISGVVVADPVQVFPVRTAMAVREDSRTWTISVEGPACTVSPERPKQNEIVFSVVERRVEDDTDAGWVAARVKGQPVSVVAAPTPTAGGTLWKATMNLPDRGRRMRHAIMIEEFETWKKDKEKSDGASRRGFEVELTTRLVYADRIELK